MNTFGQLEDANRALGVLLGVLALFAASAMKERQGGLGSDSGLGCSMAFGTALLVGLEGFVSKAFGIEIGKDHSF